MMSLLPGPTIFAAAVFISALIDGVMLIKQHCGSLKE
jgi:hypothetical protein